MIPCAKSNGPSSNKTIAVKGFHVDNGEYKGISPSLPWERRMERYACRCASQIFIYLDSCDWFPTFLHVAIWVISRN